MSLATNSLPDVGGSPARPAAPKVSERFADAALQILSMKGVWRGLALVTLVIFLATAFRAGWVNAETDFPNYYTAAVLVRKHQPLEKYYDWTWFQRQMNYGGVERQLGAYSPQTPLTMIPLVPLAGLPVQEAKRVWLICNLLFLGAAIWMLSRLTRLRVEHVWLLTFAGYFSLEMNFLLGQYYIFLLFLLTLMFYLLRRKSPGASGAAAGVALALKLYGGPFLLYFAAERRWKAVSGMIAAICCAGVVAIAVFGWPGIHYYLAHILVRSVTDGSIDLYNPGVPTISTMLRRLFVREPALNPNPLWNAPWLFFWLRTFVSLAIVVFAGLGLAFRSTTERRDFAWFTIAVLLLSTNTAPYTFILLLLPVVLLLHDSTIWRGLLLIGAYILLNMPLPAAWLFPKVWLLLALFLATGWEYRRALSPRAAIAAVSLIAVFALVDAARQVRQYDAEPGRHFEQIATGSDSLFSSFPAVSRFGLFYQSMGRDRYVLRWLHDGRREEVSLDGHALHPTALPDGSVLFELVANGTSRMMRFDPATRIVASSALAAPVADENSAVSPDGKWIAFTSFQSGPKHLWLRNIATGRETLLAGGNCDSSWPAWQLDSRAVVFASDCGRALGLPALYRAPVPEEGSLETAPRPVKPGRSLSPQLASMLKSLSVIISLHLYLG